ncbi:MAG: Clp protease N-terminal domain-containing protein, partial [Candidatus Fimimonas sp.]
MQTEKLQTVFENAYMFAKQLRVPELKAEHVLYELSVVDSDAKRILEEFGLTSENLRLIRTGRGGVVVDNKEIRELNTRAGCFARVLGSSDVDC